MKWFPDWSNEVAVVLGSGPSVKRAFATILAKSRVKVIAVNNGFYLYPQADVLYATDAAWWHHHNGARTFTGLKITANRFVQGDFPDVKRVDVPLKEDKRRPTIIFEPKGLIGSGGNSGFQALNLAVQFGSKQIILVGFDMSVDRGLHWHGKHKPGLRNPEAELIAKWREALDRQAPALKEAGVRVLNASPYSALTAYPKFKLEEALLCFGKSRSTVRA